MVFYFQRIPLTQGTRVTMRFWTATSPSPTFRVHVSRIDEVEARPVTLFSPPDGSTEVAPNLPLSSTGAPNPNLDLWARFSGDIGDESVSDGWDGSCGAGDRAGA